jgi:hypothetical protein
VGGGLFWEKSVNKWQKKIVVGREFWNTNKGKRRGQVVAGRHVGTRITRAILAKLMVFCICFTLREVLALCGTHEAIVKGHVPGLLPLRGPLTVNRRPRQCRVPAPMIYAVVLGIMAFIGRNARVRSL